jgi:hypothetical protein
MKAPCYIVTFGKLSYINMHFEAIRAKIVNQPLGWVS